MKTKQVIVIRKDLKMRRGKEIAQGSHASIAFMTRRLKFNSSGDAYRYSLPFSDSHIIEIQNWLNNSFRKITVYVNSEEELLDVYNKAKEKGLEVHLVEDSGLTEFKGIVTKTCLAIGPHSEEKFEGITDKLPLY